MTKLQKQIVKKKAEIAYWGDAKWYYYTVRTLKEELKELEANEYWLTGKTK